MIRPTETGQLVNADGKPVTAGDASPPMGEHSGMKITNSEDSDMPKASADGIYQSGKTRIKVRKGDEIPAGAEPVEGRAKQAAPKAERSKGRAPENKSKGQAPEDRTKD